MKVTEAHIENALLEYFNTSGFIAFKNYDQARFDGDVYVKHKWQMRGVADITLLTPRGVVYVEVKTPRGKQSVFQKRFEHKCKSVGIRYEVCRSLSDGKKLLKEICQTDLQKTI